MSINLHQITKIYGTQKAVDQVGFVIEKGDVVGLLGPNGAGKSTLMKIITCFVPPTEGTATVMGFDVLQQSVEVRRLIGYLPENNPLYVDMYVMEYLEFVAGIHRLNTNRATRIRNMIELTGLGSEKHKKIGALSKGFRQRLGLASALLHDPKVLILDEPTSGLDPNQLVEIRALIKEIGKEKTVMLSTHIMQEVEAICNRAIVINKGKIVADTSLSALIAKTGDELILVELDQSVDIKLLKTIPNVKYVEKGIENYWMLHPRKNVDIRPDINRWTAANKLNLLSMKKQILSMEEWFQRLTKNE